MNARHAIYIVAPGTVDEQQARKRAIMTSACARNDLTAYFPPFNGSSPHFDLNVERTMIKGAALAVVDLSHERPSCYFELGMIEALDAPVFLIAEYGTNIHQTSHRHAVRYYSDLADYERAVEEALSALRS